MDEIDKLLNELQNMKTKASTVPNNRETWKKIGDKDWSELGFDNEDELKQWILDNPYCNA